MPIRDRMRHVLSAEAAAIAALKVTDAWEQAARAIIACSGKIVTTGMGKAGMTARKFAAVLCSTGTPASFIEAGEAAHGDLGLIAPGDCLIAFSTSGKTREVLELIQLGRHIGLETVIGVTFHPDSALRDLSNALALAVMDARGITRHD